MVTIFTFVFLLITCSGILSLPLIATTWHPVEIATEMEDDLWFYELEIVEESESWEVEMLPDMVLVEHPDGLVPCSPLEEARQARQEAEVLLERVNRKYHRQITKHLLSQVKQVMSDDLAMELLSRQ